MNPFMLITYFHNYGTVKKSEVLAMNFYLKLVCSAFIQRREVVKCMVHFLTGIL